MSQYFVDLNETRTMGQDTSALRTDDQTKAARFWASTTANYFWNGVAVRLANERHTTLSENARLFAALNVTMADAGIVCWDAKYTYVFWRPITAIRAANSADAGWLPLIPTPPHPEYPSGHSTVSGAAAVVLAGYFGEDTAFFVDTDRASYPAGTGVLADPLTDIPSTRSFTNFTSALEEVKDARIDGGIHFRTACNHGQAAGIAVANYIAAHAFLPLNGQKTGQLGK
jgi:hypothetical protein